MDGGARERNGQDHRPGEAPSCEDGRFSIRSKVLQESPMNKVKDVARPCVTSPMALPSWSRFGLCGIPENLLVALRDRGAKNLTMTGNNAGH
jgi:hypothetical protein